MWVTFSNSMLHSLKLSESTFRSELLLQAWASTNRLSVSRFTSTFVNQLRVYFVLTALVPLSNYSGSGIDTLAFNSFSTLFLYSSLFSINIISSTITSTTNTTTAALGICWNTNGLHNVVHKIRSRNRE